MKTYLSILLIIALTGCSGMQSRPTMGDRNISTKETVSDPAQFTDTVIEWGGVIMESSNLEETTEIQVLAYPLKDNGKPDLDDLPDGRFIAIHPGYLETADYAKGRTLTLSGKVSGKRQGRVGKAEYAFPLIQADEIQLWPLESKGGSKSRVNFGIGVGSGGGRTRGSIGIGIGF
jgi:outer membrane lipoprotein